MSQLDSHTWALASASGRESATWMAGKVDRASGKAVLTCEVTLAGRYFEPPLVEEKTIAPPDFELAFHGVDVAVATLDRLYGHIRQWLDLRASTSAQPPLTLDCQMGELFHQEIRLILGPRADILSSGHPVATVTYRAGRLAGELSFVTNETCLAELCEGLAIVLRGGIDAA